MNVSTATAHNGSCTYHQGPDCQGMEEARGGGRSLPPLWTLIFTQDSTGLKRSPPLTAFYLAFREKRFPPGVFNEQNPPSTHLSHGGPRDQQKCGHSGLKGAAEPWEGSRGSPPGPLITSTAAQGAIHPGHCEEARGGARGLTLRAQGKEAESQADDTRVDMSKSCMGWPGSSLPIFPLKSTQPSPSPVLWPPLWTPTKV